MSDFGGCNVLDYLIECPKEIVTVDCNCVQSYMLELKLAIVTVLEGEKGFEIIARANLTLLNTVYHISLRERLSTGAKLYWDKNLPKKGSLLHLGTANKFAYLIFWIIYVIPKVHHRISPPRIHSTIPKIQMPPKRFGPSFYIKNNYFVDP